MRVLKETRKLREGPSGRTYRFADFALDLSTGRLLRDGAEVRLRPKAFELLRLLVEGGGRLFSKDELIQTLWPDVIASEDSLVQVVSDVRAALGGAGAKIAFDPTTGNVDTETDGTVPEATDESITLSAGHGLTTGDKVVYHKGANANTAIGGLSEGGNYFVRVDGNRVTLFDSKAHAEDGSALAGRVDLTSVGSGTGHNFRPLSTSAGTAVGIGIERIDGARMQRHVPGLAELRLPNGQQALVEINIADLETDRLTEPHAGDAEQPQEAVVGRPSQAICRRQRQRASHQASEFIVRVQVRLSPMPM